MDNRTEDKQQSQQPNRSEPQALSTNFYAPSPHAYTQPANIQTDPRFFSPFPPSPSPGLYMPEHRLPDSTGQQFALAALNFHQGTEISHAMQLSPAPGPLPSMAVPTAPTPHIEASSKAKVPGQPTEKHTASRRGKGGRSGKNARAGGHSDTEINPLDENLKKEADITVPAKWDEASALKLVEYITSPEQWDRITTSLNKICQDASQILFNNSYTTTQCINKWQSVFRLYKATKRYLNHTGGGDGDEDQTKDDMVSDSDDNNGDKKTKTKKKNGQKYSSTAMTSFSEGPLYPLILRVADGRADIERPIEFSSHRKPEEIDSDVRKTGKKRKKSDAGDLQDVLSEALRSVKNQRDETAMRENERFAYQKRRDERVEQQEAEKMKLEHEKIMIERLSVELRQKRELEDLRYAKLERYRQMRDSSDPLEQEYAKKLAEEIRSEQGL